MTTDDFGTETPTSPPPSPRSITIVIILVAVVVGGAFWLLRSPGDDTASTEGALEDAPTLGDLAELEGATPENDDAAPDFSVVTLDGDAFTLSQHLAEDGRPVVINLWASWCFPCRAEMPAIDAFANANQEIKVVGVAVQDDPVAAAEFADEIGVTYTIGLDEKDEVNGAYAPLGLPATFIVDAKGIIVKRIFGGVTQESLETDVAELLGA